MKTFTTAIVTSAILLAGCTTNPFTGEQQLSNTAGGALLGSAIGAGTGALIGVGTSANTRTATLIGAGVGALAGAGVGAYMDKEEAALRRQLQGTGVSVTRLDDRIVLNMPGNVTFDFGRADIKAQFYDVLNSVAIVLREYNRTLIDVNGYTDNVGTASANQQLSLERARAVANYLAGQQVNSRRMALNGFGESQPIASNSTEAGRAQNRRVEIHLLPITQS